MAKYSNVVEYNVVTDVDTSGIVKLQNELTKLKQALKFDKSSFSQLGFDDAKIDKSIRKVNQLQTAITAAFNPKIGTIDLSKLNASLQREHTSLQMIVKDWEQMGTRGTMAISNLSNALLSMNKGAMNVNTTLSKVANTFSNTVRWGITASIFQEMMSSVQGAVSYMKDLDESLTNIQMVTNSSKEDMRELAQYANQAAQALGSTTTDYTNAVKVFVQEGFSERESKQYANLSTKLANVSEQSTDVTSDQITAYRNAFQLDYQQTVEAMDKVANVANNTASNVNELMTASQRAASVAQAVGTSQDSFLAAIATIESVTRQSAEEIGNGLKTIYQRFADIKVGDSTEDGVDYGQYANALKSVGVDVLDVAGQFKGMDQILAELQEVWSSLDDTMKIAVGEKVAGKFQYNRFAALMNNPEYYQKALGATQNAGGMMDQMNEYYMQGIEGRLNTLQAAGEQVMSTLFNQDAVEPVIEQVTELVNGLNSMVDAAGGLTGVVQVLGAVMLRTFSTQIAGTVSNIATAISTVAANSRNANQLQTTAQLVGLSNYTQSQGAGSVTGKLVAGVADNYSSLSDKTQEKIRDLSQQIVELEEQKTNVLKEQQGFFGEINSRATEEKVIIEEQLQALGQQIKILREKEKAGNITAQEQDELVLLREQAKELGTVRKTYNDIAKACAGYTKELANGAPITQEMVAQVEKWKQETSNLGINISELTRLMEELGIAEGNLKIGESMVDDIIQMSNFEASVNNVIKTLSGITSIAFGMSMLGDMFRVLTDESTTLEEKLDAVVMNGLMGLTMLLPGLATIATQMKALTVEYLVQTGAITANSTAEEVNNAIKAQGVGLTIKAIALKVADIAKTVASTVATTAYNVVAAIRNVLDGNWVAIAAAAVIAAGALAIGVAAIASAWINANGEVARANQEFEKQNEILTETKRNYQDVAENLESLNNSLDKIKDMRSSLDDMKEGTDEWKEAVRKLNMEILTLIQTYPEIAKYVSNENGLLTLDEEGMNKFYQEQVDKANYLNDVNSVQQINTLNAKNDQLIAQYAQRNNISSNEVRQALAQATEEGIKNGEVKIEGRDDLTASFAELASSILSNNATIETLTSTIGSLNDTFENNFVDGMSIANDAEVVRELSQRFGGYEMFDEYGNSLGFKNADLSAQTTNDELRALIEQVTGSKILKAEDVSWFNDVLKVTLENGKELELTSEKWLQLLAAGEQATRAQNEWFENNKSIAEALGQTYNSETGKYEGGFQLNEQQRKLIEDYQNNTEIKVGDEIIGFADYLKNDGINSVEEFCKALADTDGALFQFSETLSDIQSAVSLSDLDYEYEKSDKTTADTENYNKQLDKLTQEAAEAYDIDLDDIIDQAKAFREELELTEGAARDLAIQNQRMTKGIDALYDGWENWSKILATSDHAAKDYIDTMQEVTLAIADLVGASQDLELSNEFFESAENLADIQLAAEGDIDAINRLGIAVGVDMVNAMDAFTEAEREAASALDLSDADSQAIADRISAFDNAKGIVIDGLNEIKANLDNLSVGQDISEILNTEDWVNALNTLAMDTQMTVEQMNSLLSSVGMKADVTVEHVPTEIEVPEYTTEESVEQISPGRQIWDDSGDDLVATEPPTYRKTSATWISGYKKVNGYIDVAQISTGGDAGTPAVTFVGNGPVSYSSTPSGRSDLGGSSGRSSTPKSSKTGGSSSKSKNAKAKDNAKSEWDYLTDITNDLDRASAAMEKMSKLEDRLYGASRISNLQQLKNEYAGYVDLLEEEEKLAQNHAKRLRTRRTDENGNLTINGYAGIAGVGTLQFDGLGNLENGREIEQALLGQLNSAINEYNWHRNDEDPSWYEEQVNTAQQNYDGFLKALGEYEDTLGKIEDAQNEQQEYLQKIQDNSDKIVDAIQEGIEDILKADESNRDFNRLYADWRQGGNGYSHFRNTTNYYSQGLRDLLSPSIEGQSLIAFQTQTLADRIKDFKDVFDGNSKNADKEKYSEQDAYDNLREAIDNLTDNIESAIDYYDSLLENIGEASAKMDDLIDSRLAEYDSIGDYLDTRLDQIGLLFGNNYNAQSQIYGQKIETNLDKLVTLNTSIEAKQATVKSLEELKASGKELSTEELEQLRDARDKVNDLQEEQLSTETSLLQDIAAKLEADVNTATDEMVRKMFGGADVDWLSQQWELATRNSEQYYDDYNRAFEIEKLQVKYQDLLNATQATSLNTQQRITAQMNQQLEYLRNKTNLSQYDVQYAQAQLEILQKTIALEEARNNKSQMRLQRNAAGNYDFVYAADEEAVNDAGAALLNAQQEAYNLSKNAYLNTYENALNAAQKAKQMIISIATDATLSTEEQTERIQYILNNLKDYMDGVSVELGEIAVNLYADVAKAEELISQENLGNLENTFKAMEDKSFNILEHIDDRFSLSVVNMLQDTATINKAIDDAFKDLNACLDDYQSKTEEVLEACGDSYDTFVEDSIEYAHERTDALDDSLKNFTKDIRTLNKVISDSAAQMIQWGKSIDSALANAKQYINYANKLEKQQATKEAAAAKAATHTTAQASKSSAAKASRTTSSSSGSSSSGGGNSNGTKSGGWSTGDMVGFTGWYHADSWGSGPSGHWYEGQPGAVRISSFSGSSVGGSQSGSTGSYDVHIETPDGGWLGWLKYSQLFNTGGYTGSWTNGMKHASNGKLAILHEKELVLNKQDTANMLSAVEVVRNIMSGLNTLPSLGGILNTNVPNNTTEQRVEINATFPGVTEAIEIKQALEQLADNAYQFANKYTA